MNTFSLRHYWVASCCLLISSFSSFAQTDCEPPTGFVADFIYPFGVQLHAYWDNEPETYWRLTYGEPEFDPYQNEGDSIIVTSTYVVYSNGPVLPAETHFEVYVQSICSEGDTSLWVGPIDIYRDFPPDSCGYDVEHACEISVEPETGVYFVIPEVYQDHFPLELETDCHNYSQTAWYTFIAPDNGEVLIDASNSSTYVTLFNESFEEVFCRLNQDTCIASENPVDSLRLDSIPLSLVPGMRYYAAVATVLFCDDIGGSFFYWDALLQITSNSPEVLCDEPSNFEVHFNYPFGETAYGTWQGDFGNYEIYYGEPSFDPYAMEGDVMIEQSFNSGVTGFWFGEFFPPDIHNDAYIRQVCDSVASDWVGPIDIYRPLPPDSCGWDMEHACEIYPTEVCAEYFIIPEDYQDYSIHPSGCEDYDRAGWFMFTAPATGEVELDFQTSTLYYTLYDSLGEELECFRDTCLPGFAPEPWNNIPLTLTPGEQYFVTAASALLCSDGGLPFWYHSGLCIQGQPDSLQVSLDPPALEAACDDPVIEPELIITGGCPPYNIEPTSYGFPGGCPEPIAMEYLVTDDCGEQITVVYYQSWEQDQTPPEVDCSGLTDSLLMPAEGELEVIDYTDFLIIEDCDFLGDTVFGGSIVQSPASGTVITLAGAQIFEFIVTDLCFNETTCQTSIEIYLDPLVVTHAMDTVYECEEEIPLFELEITGGCPPYDVVGEEEYFAINECETVFQAAFTVQDECGQEVYIEHEYLITDTTPPVLICPETDTLWASGGFATNPYGISDVSFSDNCNDVTDLSFDPSIGESLPIGEYTFTFTAVDACGNEGICSTPLVVADPVGIGESLFDLVYIYQRESSLMIDYPVQLRSYRCQLYDLNGKKLNEVTLNDEPASIDLSGLSAGTYLLTFSDREQVLHSRRVRVE